MASPGGALTETGCSVWIARLRPGGGGPQGPPPRQCRSPFGAPSRARGYGLVRRDHRQHDVRGVVFVVIDRVPTYF